VDLVEVVNKVIIDPPVEVQETKALIVHQKETMVAQVMVTVMVDFLVAVLVAVVLVLLVKVHQVHLRALKVVMEA
jgi:hypothetical protein